MSRVQKRSFGQFYKKKIQERKFGLFYKNSIFGQFNGHPPDWASSVEFKTSCLICSLTEAVKETMLPASTNADASLFFNPERILTPHRRCWFRKLERLNEAYSGIHFQNILSITPVVYGHVSSTNSWRIRWQITNSNHLYKSSCFHSID